MSRIMTLNFVVTFGGSAWAFLKKNYSLILSLYVGMILGIGLVTRSLDLIGTGLGISFFLALLLLFGGWAMKDYIATFIPNPDENAWKKDNRRFACYVMTPVVIIFLFLIFILVAAALPGLGKVFAPLC